MHTHTRSQGGASTRPGESDSKVTRRWSVVPRSIRVLTGEAVARILRVPSRDRGHARASPRPMLEREKQIPPLRLLGRIKLRLVKQRVPFWDVKHSVLVGSSNRSADAVQPRALVTTSRQWEQRF